MCSGRAGRRITLAVGTLKPPEFVAAVMTAPGSDLRLRRYDEQDAAAVWRLHELAMEPTATDPDDIPGTEDLRDVEGAYLETGGEFLVGVLPGADAGTGTDTPTVGDGLLVAMGGVLPNQAGHEDERSVAGAAELHRMRVAPAYQREGYGRELLHALEKWAREAGFDPLLATTARTQPAAVEFYRQEGYEAVGESTEAGYRLVHFEKSLR
jgi:GNAT superfamily N-acetyltransferase